MKKIYYLLSLLLLMLSSTTYAGLSILLVHDNNADITRVEVIKTAIVNSGNTFTLYDAVVEGSSPSYVLMSGFDLVVWYTGNDYAGLYFWNGNETDNEGVKQYIDNGGMLWIQGLDFMFDRYSEVPYDFMEGDFVKEYMGINQYFAQSHVDDGLYSDGVSQLDLANGNNIFTMTPLLWTYETMWYVDAYLPSDLEDGVYKMGPAGYDFENYYSVVYHEKGEGKVLTCAFETARFDTQESCDNFIAEGLTYFSQFSSGTGVPVESIEIYGAGNATTITEDGGTLQMFVNVLPEDATIQAVTWSVTNGTGYAFIDNTGLLTATGTSIGNGTVWVKATSFDGTNISDSLEVTISNQTNNPEFEVLLVNDNSNGVDRYLVIDTTLLNLGYNYDIYNTVNTGISPDFGLLSNYDMVIWYTGNNGVNLKLWDISDTNNYKFNQALMNYINHNGNVWVQGLDFMYDIVGGAPDAFGTGQFIYDYMGISNYVAQSYVDDDALGVPMLNVAANDISTINPISWVYETMWYVDALEISSSAHGMYKMGPTGYVFDDYYSALYKQIPNKGFIISWAFETARIDTRANTEAIFDEVLTYVKDHSGTGINEWNNDKAKITAAYPNPAEVVSTVTYNLHQAAQIQFELHDITGRIIYSQNLGYLQAGEQSIELNKNTLNLNGGIYLYTLSIDTERFTGKLIFN
jgi:hypothetical protein